MKNLEPLNLKTKPILKMMELQLVVIAGNGSYEKQFSNFKLPFVVATIRHSNHRVFAILKHSDFWPVRSLPINGQVKIWQRGLCIRSWNRASKNIMLCCQPEGTFQGSMQSESPPCCLQKKRYRCEKKYVIPLEFYDVLH